MEKVSSQECKVITQFIVSENASQGDSTDSVSETMTTEKQPKVVCKEKSEILDLRQCIISEVEKATSEKLNQIEHSEIIDPKEYLERLANFIKSLTQTKVEFQELNCKLDQLIEDAKEGRVREKEVQEAVKKLEGLENPKEEKANCLKKMGFIYKEMEYYRKAEECYLACLSIQEVIFGSQHSDLATTYSYLGALYDSEDDFEKAEKYYLKCLAIREAVLDPQHLDLATVYSDLGLLYYQNAHYKKAEECYLKCLGIREAVLDSYHPDLATIYNNLGLLYKKKLEYQKAEDYLIKCLRIDEVVFDAKHPDLATTYNNLAILYDESKQYEKAEEYYVKCLEIREAVLSSRHPDLLEVRTNLKNLRDDKRS